MVSSVLTYADRLGLKANDRFIKASYDALAKAENGLDLPRS